MLTALILSMLPFCTRERPTQRVINVMFIQSSDDSPIEYPAVIGYVATIAIALNILLGIFPSVIMGLVL